MNAPIRQFKSLALPTKNVTAIVEEFNKENNIPTQVFPKDEPPQAAVPQIDTMAPAEPVKAKKRSAPAPTRRFAAMLPEYLCNAIAQAAAKSNVTKRYIMLQALRDAGYDIKEIDFFEDGRRGDD